MPWGVPIAQAEVVELVFTDFLQIKKEDLDSSCEEEELDPN